MAGHERSRREESARRGTIFASDGEAIAHAQTMVKQMKAKQPAVRGAPELLVIILHEEGRDVAQISMHDPESVERD
jgi:hypothetical protein